MSEGMDVKTVECPYCGEPVEIVIERDLEGEMVWDCEVCCRPWRVVVRGRDEARWVEVATLEG